MAPERTLGMVTDTWVWLIRNKSEACTICKLLRKVFFQRKYETGIKILIEEKKRLCSRLEITVQSPNFHEQEWSWRCNVGKKYPLYPFRCGQQGLHMWGTPWKVGPVISEHHGQESSYMRAKWKPKSELLPSLKAENFQNTYSARLGHDLLWSRSSFSLSKWKFYSSFISSVVSSLIKRTLCYPQTWALRLVQFLNGALSCP